MSRPFRAGGGALSDESNAPADDVRSLWLAGRTEAARLALVRAAEQSVYRYLKAMVRDAELARDLTQDTFVRAFRSLGSFRGDAQLATWMLAIARHVAFNSARRRRLEERWNVVTEALPDVADPRSAADPRDPLLLDALAALPAAQREAVALYYLEDLDIESVARLTKRPANTVKSDLHRARTALRAVLGEPDAGNPNSLREGSTHERS